MTAATPHDALRLLAALIATDIRAGSPLLALPEPVVEQSVRRRGRPKSVPYAVAANTTPIPIAA